MRLSARPPGHKSGILFVNSFLLAAFVVGLGYSFFQLRETTHLKREFQELSIAAGRIDVVDPQSVYLKQMESDRDMTYRWRLELPADTILHTRTDVAGGHKATTTQGGRRSQSIVICAGIGFRNDECILFSMRNLSSSHSRISSDPVVIEFLKRHWHDLEVTVFDAPQQKQLDFAKPTRLLEIRVPDSLHDDLNATQNNTLMRYVDRPIMRYQIGAPEGFSNMKRSTKTGASK